MFVGLTRPLGVGGVKHDLERKAVLTRQVECAMLAWEYAAEKFGGSLRRLCLAILRHSKTPQGPILSKLHMPSILNSNRTAGPAGQIVMLYADCLNDGDIFRFVEMTTTCYSA
jgi:hypothetical protein